MNVSYSNPKQYVAQNALVPKTH